MHMHLLYINESIVHYIMDTCELTNILWVSEVGLSVLLLCCSFQTKILNF